MVAEGAALEVLTPDVLEPTYGAPLEVLVHGGMPVVDPRLQAPGSPTLIGGSPWPRWG